MVRDVAATLDRNEIGAHRCRVAAQIRFEIGVRSVGEHVLVFEQQQVLFTAVVEQRLLDRQRFAVRHPPQPSDPEQGTVGHQSSADQSRVSRTCLTRLRKPAA